MSSYREDSCRLRRQFNSSPDLKARSILLSDAHVIEDEDDHVYSIQKPNPSFVDHLNNKSTVASKDGLFTYLGRPTAQAYFTESVTVKSRKFDDSDAATASLPKS